MTSDQFEFRLRFVLGSGYRINAGTSEVVLAELPTGAKITLRAGSADQAISDTATLILIGRPFESEVGARETGLRARTALMLWAAENLIGIDFGDDLTHTSIGDTFKQDVEQRFGVSIRPEVHGIDVFPVEPPSVVFSIRADGHVLKRFDQFQQEFAERLVSGSISDKQQVAFDLFLGSFFDSQPESRVVSLISAIEALLRRDLRPATSQALLDRFVDAVRNEPTLPAADVQGLVGGIEDLRRQSIGASGRQLVGSLLGEREFGGMGAAKFFRQCYSLRSEIVHQGHPSDQSLDLEGVESDLRRMVSAIKMADTIRARRRSDQR